MERSAETVLGEIRARGRRPQDRIGWSPGLDSSTTSGDESRPRINGAAPEVALYEQARRDAVGLWRLKGQLWKSGQERFYKTSSESKAIAPRVKSER